MIDSVTGFEGRRHLTREQVACEGVLIVSGIARSGHRDILSLDVAHTETEATYADLFNDQIGIILFEGSLAPGLYVCIKFLTQVRYVRL